MFELLKIVIWFLIGFISLYLFKLKYKEKVKGEEPIIVILGPISIVTFIMTIIYNKINK